MTCIKLLFNYKYSDSNISIKLQSKTFINILFLRTYFYNMNILFFFLCVRILSHWSVWYTSSIAAPLQVSVKYCNVISIYNYKIFQMTMQPCWLRVLAWRSSVLLSSMIFHYCLHNKYQLCKNLNMFPTLSLS